MKEIVEDFLSGFGIALGVCALLLAINWNTSRLVYRGLRRYAKDQQFGWDDSAIHFRSAYATSHYPFTLCEKLVETRNVFIIYLAPLAPVFLPKRVMEPAERDDLRARLTADHSDQSSPMSS